MEQRVTEEGEQEHEHMMMAEPGEKSSSLKNIWPGHVPPDLPSHLDLKGWIMNHLHHFFFLSPAVVVVLQPAAPLTPLHLQPRHSHLFVFVFIFITLGGRSKKILL